MKRGDLVITEEEAEELYRYLRNQYISPAMYPRLNQLWTRISLHLKTQERLVREASTR